MNSKRVIPFLMLHHELLYKSCQFNKMTYIGDPLVAVKIFNEKQAQEICLVDIDITRNGSEINFQLLKDIASECFMPLSYGGGVRSIEDIQKLIYIGFEKIILNTIIHENPEFVSEAVKTFGSSTIIGCIDFKKEKNDSVVYSNGGTRKTNKTVSQAARVLEKQGVGEILLNNIDRDGSMQGLDLVITREISNLVNTPVITSGGVGQKDDIIEGFKTGADAIACGSFCVYKGPLKAVLINYPDKDEIDKLNA